MVGKKDFNKAPAFCQTQPGSFVWILIWMPFPQELAIGLLLFLHGMGDQVEAPWNGNAHRMRGARYSCSTLGGMAHHGTLPSFMSCKFCKCLGRLISNYKFKIFQISHQFLSTIKEAILQLAASVSLSFCHRQDQQEHNPAANTQPTLAAAMHKPGCCMARRFASVASSGLDVSWTASVEWPCCKRSSTYLHTSPRNR